MAVQFLTVFLNKGSQKAPQNDIFRKGQPRLIPRMYNLLDIKNANIWNDYNIVKE